MHRWFLIFALAVLVQTTTDQCSAPPTTTSGQTFTLVPPSGEEVSPNAPLFGQSVEERAIFLGCMCYDQQGSYPCNLPPADPNSLAWGCLPR